MPGVVPAAAVSVAASLVMLGFFALLPTWRRKPRGFKHILLCATVSNLILAMAYFLDPGDHQQCRAQAGLMQYFEVSCSWGYTAFLGVEIAITVWDHKLIGANLEARIFGMHLLVLSYASISTCLLFGLDLNGDAGAWCWSRSSMWQMVSYLVLWLELALILGSSVAVVCALRNPNAHKYAVAKLFAIPFCWMLLHIPGTFRRCFVLIDSGCDWCGGTTMATIQGICDPSQGTLNLLLFGLTDTRIYSEINDTLSRVRRNRRTTVVSAGNNKLDGLPTTRQEAKLGCAAVVLGHDRNDDAV